jgi:hypothetical protein
MNIHEYATMMMREPRSSGVRGCSAGLSGIAAMVLYWESLRPCRNQCHGAINETATASQRLFLQG